jgi:hypothetical protein
MTNAIIVTAQKFANERNMTVFLGGDWNCPVDRIELIAGASMPQPLNPLNGDQENDGIDSMLIFNPVQAENEADAGARDGAEEQPEEQAEAEAEDEDEDEDEDEEQAGAEQPLFQRMSLYNARFFGWTGNVSRDDMGGLEPARIDRIYRRGEKHRPIIAYINQT